jgi:hypothetical protein
LEKKRKTRFGNLSKVQYEIEFVTFTQERNRRIRNLMVQVTNILVIGLAHTLECEDPNSIKTRPVLPRLQFRISFELAAKGPIVSRSQNR